MATLLTLGMPPAFAFEGGKAGPNRPRPIWELHGHNREVQSAAFSLDGKQLATGTQYTAEVILWDVATGKQLRRFEISETDDISVGALGFSADGRRLAAGAGGILTVWEIVSGKPVFSRKLPSICAVVFSRDGKSLVVDNCGKVSVLDADTGRIRRTLKQKSDRGSGGRVMFSPDNRRLVVGASWEVRVYDFATGKQQLFLEGFASSLCHLRFGPGGHTLLTVHGNNKLRSWDAVTGKLLSERKWSKVNVWRIWSRGLSGDWRLAACADLEVSDFRTVRLCDVATGRLVLRILPANKHEPRFDGATVALSPDGRWLATAASDGLGLVELWDLNALPKKK